MTGKPLFQKLILCALFLFSFSTLNPLMAQDEWTFTRNKHDLRKASINKKTTVLGMACSATLEFVCAKDGKGGVGHLSMYLTIAPSSELPGFDFSFFEGPNAPVTGKKLMTIALEKAGRNTEFQTELSGWYSADIKDGFVFGTTAPARDKNSHTRKIVHEIQNSPESITVSIRDGSNPKKIISVTFPLIGSQSCFDRLMKHID